MSEGEKDAVKDPGDPAKKKSVPEGRNANEGDAQSAPSTSPAPVSEPKVSPRGYVETRAGATGEGSGKYESELPTGEALLFDENRLLKEDHGKTFPHWDTEGVKEFSELFSRAWGGIIAAEKPEHALEVAACASYRKHFAGRYVATHAETVSIGFDRLERYLFNRKNPTCYILEYWSWNSRVSLGSRWNAFRAAVHALEQTPHSIILCLNLESWNDLTAGGMALEGLAPYRQKESPVPAAPEGGAAAKTRYQNIFNPGGSDFQEILLAAERQVIGKTLVRLVLLFPGLSPANYERLLKACLAGQTVLVTPANGTAEEYRPAAETLWSSAKHIFLDEAGLDRKTMAFKSKELEQEAEELAWEDEQAMFDVFTAVSRESPLFGDLRDAGDRELNLAYLNGAAVMADRAPSCFGPKWLEALVADLYQQAKLKIPDLSAEHPELMVLLAALAEDNRQQLLTRFAERVALLADFLIDAGKEKLVTDLVERMGSNRLHEIALRIVSRIGRFSDEERIASLRIFLNHGDRETKAAALRGFAVEYLENPAAKAAYLREVKTWLEDPAHADNENLRAAAIAFPAVFLETCHSWQFSKKASPNPAGLLFNLVEGVTILDWMAVAMKRKDFGSSAARFMPEIDTPDPEAFLLAMTLYYLAAMPDDGRTEAMDLVRQIRGSHLIEVRNQLRFHWQELADYWWSVEKAGDGDRSTLAGDRVAVAQRLRAVCLNLIRN